MWVWVCSDEVHHGLSMLDKGGTMHLTTCTSTRCAHTTLSFDLRLNAAHNADTAPKHDCEYEYECGCECEGDEENEDASSSR